MPTSFVDIYASASSKIDDPLLTQVYEQSVIGFCSIMYNYLNAAIPSFNNPIEEMLRLRSITEPNGETDSYTGNGSEDTFAFTHTPSENSLYEVLVDGIAAEATYNSLTNSMVLTTAPSNNSEILLNWYFPGQFTADLYAEEKDILAMLTVLNWAEKEKNFKLDIRTLLGDKTYKAETSARANVGSKVAWVESMQEDCQKKMNKFAWNYSILKRKYGGEPAWLHLSD